MALTGPGGSHAVLPHGVRGGLPGAAGLPAQAGSSCLGTTVPVSLLAIGGATSSFRG